MKICILGSGALGSSIGSVLSRSGLDVYLIDQWEQHVNNMNKHGLKVKEESGDIYIKVNARTDCTGIGIADLIIVLVKSFHTRKAIEGASSIIGEHTMVMSLQNGLGNEETLAEVIGEERLIGGKTYVGGVLLEPGYIMGGTTKGKYTYIGELDGSKTERISKVAEIFNKAGLLTTVSDNIVGMIWDKLLINVATGAFTSITKLPYGGLYKLPEIRDCACEAITEGINVAKANGIVLSEENPEKIWLMAAEGLPDKFKTSMLQSLEKGEKTEIDFINNSIVRWGEKVNVPTPVNKTLVACVKGMEYWLDNYISKE